MVKIELKTKIKQKEVWRKTVSLSEHLDQVTHLTGSDMFQLDPVDQENEKAKENSEEGSAIKAGPGPLEPDKGSLE